MMLPINDFNFVVAGIATFAATVGYACTRRLSASFGSDSDTIRDSLRNQSKVELEHCQPHTKEESTLIADVAQVRAEPNDSSAISTKWSKDNLKRKIPHDGFEEPEKPVNSEFGYPHNLAHIYPPPNKRFKTPPGVDDKAPAPVEILEQQPETVDSDIRDPEPAARTSTPDPPLSPSPVAETPSPIGIQEPSVVKPHLPSKAPTSTSDIGTPTLSQPTVRHPLQSTLTAPVPAMPKSFGGSSFSSGFAAFAGSSSPFSSASGHTPHSTLKSNRPVWSAAPSDLTHHQNDEAGQATKVTTNLFNPASQSLPVNVLEDVKPSTSAPSPKHTHPTGEEEEDVQMELKGVKLYIKRGSKPYAEGIVGHLKLLCHRTTLEERILFRREPLWKVSMNIRVQPTVRCAFVPEENALKFILKETVESPAAISPETNQELVIYVLKPGRACSKQDFRDFAQSLSENAHFRPSTETPSKSS